VGTWLKDKGSAIAAITGTIAAFVAVLQLFVVTPMNQRFDALERHVDQRFDAIDQRLDRVESEVSQLRQSTSGLRDRVSRSEGEIDVLREQLTSADAP